MNLFFWRKPKPQPTSPDIEQVFKDTIRVLEARFFAGMILMTQSNTDKFAHISAQLDVLAAALNVKASTSDADGAAIDALSAKVDALVAEHAPAPVLVSEDTVTGADTVAADASVAQAV